MDRFRLGRTVGYRRLRALVDHRLLARSRLVHGQRTLYVATRDGLAWAGMPQVEPARLGVSTTRHWALCARLAVILSATAAGSRCGASRGSAPPSYTPQVQNPVSPI